MQFTAQLFLKTNPAKFLNDAIFIANVTSRRTLLYSWKKGLNRDTITWLQQPIDLSPRSVKRWADRKEFEALRDRHRFQSINVERFGYDLAASNFVLSHNGSVKFKGSERWFKVDKNGHFNLPLPSTVSVSVEAIDASNTTMMYESFDYFEPLKDLKYLNLSNCKHIDDWCIDRLAALRNTLHVLDLSGCKNVSERGLTSLHRMKSLKKVILNDMKHMKQAKLTALLLEEALPNCYVAGIDYSQVDEEIYNSDNDEHQTISFLKSWEEVALAEQQEVIEALSTDRGVLDIGVHKKINRLL